MSDLAKNFIGTSFAVKFWTFLFGLFATIALYPDLVDFLPKEVTGYVVGTAKLIAVTCAVAFGWSVKPLKVTGGSIPTTPEAAARVQQETIGQYRYGAAYELGDPVPPEFDKTVKKAEEV